MAKRLIYAEDVKTEIDNWLECVGYATIGKGLSYYGELLGCIADTPTVKAVEIPESGIGDLSDGYHTFNELYHHRAVLFSVICNMMPDKAWKSKLHDTGDMYEGMFIVGVDTPQGQATYHYDINPYWDMFKVKELEKAPEWDGHTPAQAIERIGALCDVMAAVVHGQWIEITDIDGIVTQQCSVCQKTRFGKCKTNYCSCCGAKMDGERKASE